MANPQDSVLGARTYSFGPGVMYYNTSDGFIPAGFAGATGTGTYLGRTGPINWTESLSEIELMSIQTGATADDVGITGHTTEIAVPLREARTDVIKLIMRGVYVEGDTDDNPSRIWGSSRIGQRGRDIAKQATFVEIIDGAEAWDDAFRIVDFFVAVPRFSETQLVFDAETQRELAMNLHCFESRTVVDPLNRPARWATRAQVGV